MELGGVNIPFGDVGVRISFLPRIGQVACAVPLFAIAKRRDLL